MDQLVQSSPSCPPLRLKLISTVISMPGRDCSIGGGTQHAWSAASRSVQHCWRPDLVRQRLGGSVLTNYCYDEKNFKVPIMEAIERIVGK
jgi:hypothetical protein